MLNSFELLEKAQDILSKKGFVEISKNSWVDKKRSAVRIDIEFINGRFADSPIIDCKEPKISMRFDSLHRINQGTYNSQNITTAFPQRLNRYLKEIA